MITYILRKLFYTQGMKIITVTLLFLILFIFGAGVSAQVTKKQPTIVTLSKSQVVNDTYFAAGDQVKVSGTVNGDAYVAGGQVNVDGIINGDLLIAGGEVNITGRIMGDIRAAGGQITINSPINGGITAMGGTVTIGKGAHIGKGLVGAAGQYNIMGAIDKSVFVGGGQVTLTNSIGGNVLAGVGQLVIEPSAIIDGNLTYYSDGEAVIQPGSTIAGKIDYHPQPKYQKEMKQKAAETNVVLSWAGIMLKFYNIIVLSVIGAAFIAFAPRFMRKTAETVGHQTMLSAGIGLSILIGVPIIAIILPFTIIGIPMSIILLMIYGLYIYLIDIFVASWLGCVIFTPFGIKPKKYVAFLVGMLAIWLLTIIPILGGAIQFVITLSGMGALLLTKQHLIMELHEKKLI